MHVWFPTALRRTVPLGLAALCVATGAAAQEAETAPPDPAAPPENYSIHGQFTLVEQYHPSFASPYRGANSFDPGNRGNETTDATLFAGIRLWDDIEFYVDPEIDQGFGLSNTLGVAGFTSGEAYKVGAADPYIRIPRAFFRRSFGLGGDVETVNPDQNQLGGTRSADNLTFTIGKFSVTDIFDTNSLAHDPKSDFLNWSLIDTGAFDYAADAWGYSYGVTAEWTQDWWTLRAGLFDLSRVPNTTQLVRGFGQYELVSELEMRHDLLGAPGTVKLLGWLNRGRMGSYSDAVALGLATHSVPDTALVRRPADRGGFVLNAEQKIDGNLSAVLRFGFDDGSKEAFEFTEINRTIALGLSLKGGAWGRADDTVGLAGVDNAMSRAGQDYFAAGGLGILIGDGALPRYDDEVILEAYYSAAATDWMALSLDYQWIANPAYNAERGPVSVFGVRLHAAT